MASSLAVDTRICTWGNSSAMRLPKSILQAAGISSGDEVVVGVSDGGCIEIRAKEKAHRVVKPMRGITFDSLFAGYDPTKVADAEGGLSQAAGGSDGWPSDDMVGSEWDAWSA